MRVGFIGFGEAASTLSRGLLEHRVSILTCVEGRSQRSVELAHSVGVELCSNNIELAKSSDILLSAVVPAQAVEVAREVGENVKGIYVDLNNVSPATVKEALDYVSNGMIVDAAIMGGVKNGLKTPIVASGEHAHLFAELNKYGMNIEVIGDEVGQASALKMLRSVYTKGVSALLFESFYAAYEMGVDDALFKYLSGTEGPNFQKSTISRLKGSAYHAERRVQEIDEIISFLSLYEDPLMSKATREFFQFLLLEIGKQPKKSENYQELFKMLDKWFE